MNPSIHFPQQKYSPEEVFSPYGRIPFTTSPAALVDEEAEPGGTPSLTRALPGRELCGRAC